MATITDNLKRANHPKGRDAKLLAYVRETRIGSQGLPGDAEVCFTISSSGSTEHLSGK
jgi:hypothetical protein